MASLLSIWYSLNKAHLLQMVKRARLGRGSAFLAEARSSKGLPCCSDQSGASSMSF